MSFSSFIPSIHIMPQGIRLLTATAIVAAALACGAPASAQRLYRTPEAAAQAFTDALASNDFGALHTVLGAHWRRFVPANEVDRDDIYGYLAAWVQPHGIVREGEDQALLAVGTGDWTLPIPMVGAANGWRFDPRAGGNLMQTRRIGRNELAAMQAALAYYDAQREYTRADQDMNGVPDYAQKIASAPGRHDGLYWPGQGYHGYLFKILNAQVPSLTVSQA